MCLIQGFLNPIRHLVLGFKMKMKINRMFFMCSLLKNKIMNYINFYLKPLNKVLMAVFVCCTLISTFSSAQLANIDYSVRVDRILSYEGGFFGPCWESGTEEYTAWGGFTDNINNSISWASCLTCNSNGNCSYGAGAFAGSRSNTNAYTINYYLYAFENDAGSRCFYDSGDDCYYFGSPGFSYIRENAFPSASTYTNGPDAQASSSHRIRLEWSWRYSGNSNTLAPSALLRQPIMLLVLSVLGRPI